MVRTFEEILNEIKLLSDSEDDKVWIHNFEEFKFIFHSGAKKIYLNRKSEMGYLHEIQYKDHIIIGYSEYEV